MRLVEFLIHLLQAHAQTLNRLAALLGEESLIEILEEAGEGGRNLPPSLLAKKKGAQLLFFDSPQPGSNTNAYAELEGAVRELNLPALLEFHLWAYPHYRHFIEGPHDLHSMIQPSSTELVEDACQHAQFWVQCLPLHPSLSTQAEKAAQIPWLRFRAEVLKRIGKRPLGPVY